MAAAGSGGTPEPGWYHDPAGRQGHYRYWDGQQWSERTTTSPTGETSGGRWKQWLMPGLLVLGVIVLVVIVILALPGLGGGGRDPKEANPSDFCPIQSDTQTPFSHAADGRVHGGKLSYPTLGSPWGPVESDERLPYGRDVHTQNVTIEANYQPGKNWVASVLIAQLASGDGFATPAGGLDIVSACSLGVFYGDAKVSAKDVQRKSFTVDGHRAALLEQQLSFEIRGLSAKSETLLMVVVETGQAQYSLYYASVPENAPQLLPTVRGLVGSLSVD